MKFFDYPEIKKEEKTIAVFDINSSSIGGVIIKHNKNKKPEILITDRVDINFLSDMDFEILIRNTSNSFKEVLKSLRKKFPNRIDSVFCIFSSPWTMSQTRIIEISKETPFKVTKEVLNELLNKEANIFKKKWHNENESSFIEKRLMNIKLNGYSVNDPIGKSAKLVNAYTYMSIVEKKLKEQIERNIYEKFGTDDISYHTFPFTMLSILKYITNIEDGLIFVNICGEITEISLLGNGIINETISFPVGKNYIIRKIAKSFNTFPKDAISIFETYESGHSSGNVKNKMSEIMESSVNEWKNIFENSLDKIKKTYHLPQNVFLVGDEFITKEFKKSLDNNFKVNIFSHNALKHYFNFTKETEHSRDTAILLESLFADKFI